MGTLKYWKVVLIILIGQIAYAQTVVDFPYDIRDCNNNCTSNDLQPVGAYLASNITGTPFSGCVSGSSTPIYVCVAIQNTTGSNRRAASLAVDLNINGVLVTEIIKCVDTVLVGSSTTNLCFGPYNWTCGQSISLTNIFLAWNDAGQNNACPNPNTLINCNSYDLDPKCDYLTNVTIVAFQSTFDYTLNCPVSAGNYSANFVGQPMGGLAPYTYSWNFGAGASPTTATTQNVNNVTWSTPGLKTVTLTVVDSRNVSFTSTEIVNVKAPMSVSVNGRTDTIICNANAQLTALVNGGYPPYTYSWSSGLGTTATVNTPMVSGTYTVTVTDSLGCIKSGSINLTYGVANGNAGPDRVVCVNDPAITLTATGGSTYMWSTGENTPSISVDPPSSTSYYVTITNAVGCSIKDTVNVTVNPNPVAAISGPDTICPNQQINLTASGGGTYLWSTGANTATISVAPAVITTYTVTVTSGLSCSSTASKTVNVTQISFSCLTTVNGGSPKDTCEATVCVGESVTFAGNPNYPTGTYTWSGPGGFTASGYSISLTNIQASQGGTYVLSYQGSGSCVFQRSFVLSVNEVTGGNIGVDEEVCTGGSPGSIGQN